MSGLPKYTKELFILSFPIILGQLGQMLIGAGDVFIASMYKTEVVAAIGVSSGIVNPFLLFGVGLMMGISPSIAIKRGAGQTNQKSDLNSIIFYSFFTGVILTLLTIFTSQFIHDFGFDERIIPSMELYISIVAWSLPFALVFQGIKEYLQSFEDVLIPNLMSVIAVVLNLGLNYVLVFGFSGIGGYGEVGLAIASFAIRVILCLAVILYAVKKTTSARISLSLIKDFFRFSLPIACMFFLEVLAFAAVTLLSGKIGVIAAAANNLIMNMASIAFMIPLSISSAVAVKVGYSFGMKNLKEVRMYTFSSLLIGLSFIVVSSIIFFIFPENLMAFTSKDPEVIELGVKLLFVVALFQVADSVQVILSGVLRGLESTRVSFAVILFGYWIIGIPYGYYLTFNEGYGAQGLWIGLALSLGIVATILTVYTRFRYQQLKRLF